MPTAETAIFPLASAQERLWIVEQVTPGTTAYHIPLALRLTGELDREALRRSLQRVVDRHEALRTSVTEVEGRAVQLVHPSVEVALPEEAVSEDGLAQVLAVEAARPFDLAAGPLIRARLFRTSEDERVLALTLHHLVSDLWSCGVLLRELGACYAEAVTGTPAPLAEIALQYPDYAVWQRGRLHGDRLEELLGYWRQRMAGAPPSLNLPTDRPRPPVQSLRGKQLAVSLSPELSHATKDLARRCAVSPFMVLLGAFQSLLSRYAGSEDIVVGTGTATRTPQTEQLIGCFINTVPLRTSFAGDPTFVEVLDRVRETTLGALDHHDLPFDLLVAELRPQRDLSRTPFAQVMFILQNAPLPVPDLPGLRVSAAGTERGGAQCDLDVQLRETDEGYAGFVEYADDLFDPETVRRLWGHFEVLLGAALAEPGRPVRELPWLTAAELDQQVGVWNRTDAPAPDRCLHQLFEEQAAAAPQATALIRADGELGYGELDRRADALASRLRGLAVGPDVRVALCLERSERMAVAVLAVLKAGGAYVPLDPAYPADRLAHMLADARPAVLLTSGDLLGRLPVDPATGLVLGAGGAPGPRVLDLDLDLDQGLDGDGRSGEAPAPAAEVGPDNLAYVIYTSGSTGTPKGVAVTHRGVVNNIADLNRRERVGPDDRVLALSASSFDMSVYELLGTLAAGGAVVLPEADRAKDPRHWAELVEHHRVTVWNSAPSLLEALVDSYGGRPPAAPTLRAAFLGGDWIPVELPDRARALFPALRVHALGGATEASIHSIAYLVGAVDPNWAHLPYGRPMDNQQALIVGPDLRPVPPGVPGELCLAGIGLSRGYLDRPSLTAERFRPHPFAGVYPEVPAGARLYRTGDLARYSGDGTVQLLGRLDHQVKVRGFRVELGEVDAALLRHPGLAEALTVVRTDGSGRGIGLAAYVVPVAGQQTPVIAELRDHLRRTLPDHMVPEVFVPLSALPLSANGKLDRSALPAPHPVRATLGNDYVEPSTPLELAVADIWQAVLRIDRVGAHDDFFELGGNSLGVTQVASAVRENLRVDIPLREVFESATVAGQARAAAAAATAAGLDADAIATLYLHIRSMTDDTAREQFAAAEGATR
ncbi:amino acid adenylation domain-containing protein [Actinacidiphila yanglinensis]|uniref:Amino acid adenylation domain-containing protein n=1 Tax=Actinacidiphila yanglinensis TaxID=310779 RepID=A0A1H6DG64_9ACTN|nr:non-ribosomal peptide synthetase [Actinacidiphila yanglinensis]SEG84348.1 amino acid adenylation domain-containing protein [Actinacidiphila yanglinensis]